MHDELAPPIDLDDALARGCELGKDGEIGGGETGCEDGGFDGELGVVVRTAAVVKPLPGFFCGAGSNGSEHAD